MLKVGEKLWNGRIVTQDFADVYNRLQVNITQKEALGWNVEALKNGSHNLMSH